MPRHAPRHDHDASGPASVLAAKAALREEAHELQLRPAGTIPLTAHDVPVDLVITPDRVIDCRHQGGAWLAAGICWPELTEEKIAAIPLLAAQHAHGGPDPATVVR